MTVDTIEEITPDVWVSIAELARLNGVSKQAVSKRVKKFLDEGLLTVRQQGRERHVNAAVYSRLIKDTTDPAQHLRNPGVALSSGAVPEAEPAPDMDLPLADPAEDQVEDGNDKGAPKQGSYNAAKAKKAEIDAEIAYLDFQERVGKLVSKDAADSKLFEFFRRVRDRMLGLPATCADGLAAAPDARAIRVSLTEEIRKALDEVARDFEGEDSDPDAED